MKELFDQLSRNNEKLDEIMTEIHAAKTHEDIVRIENEIAQVHAINDVVLKIMRDDNE